MALLDMIHETMNPELDPDATTAFETDLTLDDKLAIEALGGIGEIPSITEPAMQLMSAIDALNAIESHMDLTAEENENEYFRAIHEAFEADLPVGEPPYDYSRDLEDIDEILMGVDVDNTGDVDQPDPEENIENDFTITDLMTAPQDLEKPNEAGSINL